MARQFEAAQVGITQAILRDTGIDSLGWIAHGSNTMRYAFLVETYETERLKVASIWSEFSDGDLPVRPSHIDKRGRSVHEHMVHQCVSENAWFINMLGIDVGAPPLPHPETRLNFIGRYVEDSAKRLAVLRSKQESWWEEEAKFFDVTGSRAWVMTRRIAHTSHHRGQLMAMLRMPTADTGGLMLNHAPTIYAYPTIEALLAGEATGGKKSRLPGRGEKPVTERRTEVRQAAVAGSTALHSLRS